MRTCAFRANHSIRKCQHLLFGLFFLCVFCQGTARASNSCDWLRNRYVAAKFVDLTSRSGLTPKETRTYAATIHHINSMLRGSSLKIPETIEIKITDPSFDAQFIPSDRTIEMPVRMTEARMPHADEILRNRGIKKLGQATLAHEYGHYLFHDNIARFYSEAGRLNASIADKLQNIEREMADQYLTRFKDELANLNEVMGVSYNKTNIFDDFLQELPLESMGSLKGDLSKPYTPFEISYYKNLEARGELNFWERYLTLKHAIISARTELLQLVSQEAHYTFVEAGPLFGPYHEVFADTVAVLAFGDLAIMAKTTEEIIRGKDAVREPSMVEDRSFVGSAESTLTTYEVHQYYAKARKHLGNTYLSHKGILSQPGRVLAALGRAVGACIKHTIDTRSLFTENRAIRNGRFVEMIDKEFKSEFQGDFPQFFPQPN